MNKKNIFLALILILVSSCAHKDPYEVKSPCVGADSDFYLSPCSKRPANYSIV